MLLFSIFKHGAMLHTVLTLFNPPPIKNRAAIFYVWCR